jgi:membrane-bound metal-dependent hydrolase YbcI (DUF457 family)
MDFLTHGLYGAGAARLVSPRCEWLGQLSIAALLDSLLMDCGSFIYWIREDLYGKYHRVFTHSIIGLLGTALISALIVHMVCRLRIVRRFGWFVSPNLPDDSNPSNAPLKWLILVSAMSCFLHMLFDLITAYGDMSVLWPFNHQDGSLKLVNSFDPVILGSTVGWFLLIRYKEWPRCVELRTAIILVVWIVAYLWLRSHFGPRAIW